MTISLKYFLINHWRKINFVYEPFSKKGFIVLYPVVAIREQVFEGLCDYPFFKKRLAFVCVRARVHTQFVPQTTIKLTRWSINHFKLIANVTEYKSDCFENAAVLHQCLKESIYWSTVISTWIPQTLNISCVQQAEAIYTKEGSFLSALQQALYIIALVKIYLLV